MPDIKSDILEVKTFGEFSITYNGVTVGDCENRSQKVWKLIEFLVANRNVYLTQNAIFEMLWNDEEMSDQPANALKNLVYRARKTLQILDVKADLIIYSRNTYKWNTDIQTTADVEDFVNYIEIAQKSDNEDDKAAALVNAISLYKGEFLPKSADIDWVVSKSAYLNSEYVKAVNDLCEIAQKYEKYKEIVIVCEKAVSLYPLDESLQCLLLKAYVSAKEYTKALNHYTKISDVFYEQLGIGLSDEIKELYKEVIHNVNKVETDIVSVNNNLHEAMELKGAYFCDFEIFRNIYRIQARSISRTGQAIQFGLVTVIEKKKDALNPANLKKIMTKLKASIIESLRQCDTISSYSPLQFVMLLPLTNYENCSIIAKRITNNFKNVYHEKDVELNITIRSIVPTDTVMF